ncbi:hypothetical protein ABW20_dc0103358 [Dactylellina cionopaga]|nr:hypothetical protein ABW20_dc0103358 [Dactylellina cionopaga]
MKLLILHFRSLLLLLLSLTYLTPVFATPHPQGSEGDTLEKTANEDVEEEVIVTRPSTLEDRVTKARTYLRGLQNVARPVPPESEWAPPLNNIAISKAQWDEFTKGLTTNMPENPFWYIFHAAYLFRSLSYDIARLSIQLNTIKGDNKWINFRDRYFKITAPLMNEIRAVQEMRNGRPVRVYKQLSHIPAGTKPGVMDKGSIFDTTFLRDDHQAQEGNPNPYPRDTLTMKVLLKKLFPDITEEVYDGETLLFVDDTNFKLVWQSVKQVYDELGPLVTEVVKYAEELWWLPNMQRPRIDVRPRQTREFKREDIGYKGYYEKFSAPLEGHEQEDQDSDWIPAGIAGRAYSELLSQAFGNVDDTESVGPNMYAAFALLYTTIYNSALPLMMDMFADISVRMNNLAMNSAVSSLDLRWGIPSVPGFSPSKATLKNWPEWTEGKYMTVAWPIPPELLEAALPLLKEQRRMVNGMNNAD